MLHSSEQLTITDLLSQVSEWSIRNFGSKQASDLGICEEVGELCHGILKRYQGIRGFHDPEKFKAHVGDAFADIGIYLLNYAGTNGVLLTLPTDHFVKPEATDRFFLANLLLHLTQLVSFSTRILDDYPSEALTDGDRATLGTYLQTLWMWVDLWAYFHGFNFLEIVTATWLRVRQRDWEKNKTNAHLTDGGYQPDNGEQGQVNPL